MTLARKPTPERQRRAVVDRDAAIARVRRATTGTLALATALVAAFAGLAAASTHSRKAIRQAAKTRRSNATTTVQTPSVSPPPVQPSGGSTPSPTPPAQAPTPSVSPPAAVSGAT
jgi:hypothetical protein